MVKVTSHPWLYSVFRQSLHDTPSSHAFFMAASITIAHGHTNRDLPVRVPHLMPFHIQHTGPAPVSTYFRIRPQIGPLWPSSTSEESPLSGDTEKELTATAVNSKATVEEKEDTPGADVPVPITTTAETDVTTAKAQASALTSRVSRTGTIARLAESAKRYISSFRGRTVHGVEVALPKGYVGIVLRGDANGKAHQPTTSNAKRRRAQDVQHRRKPVVVEDDDDDGCLDDAAEMSPEDGRPVRVLKPAARFDSFDLWHPDIPVDEGKDEYLRSLSEWVSLAAEVRSQ
jgi:hypothetical protein